MMKAHSSLRLLAVLFMLALPKVLRWFRGKTRLLNGICPRVGICKSTLFGYDVELDLSDHIQRNNVYRGTYEPHDSRLVQRYLSAGHTFVDIGANFGYYSLMAASAVGNSGRVFGFEPNPELCDHLRGTIEKNEIVNITVERAGVSDEAGWADLFLPIKRGNNTATMVPNEGGRPLRVPVVTLDEYLDRFRIARVDFLKIDVEGFEPRVIRGARGAIRARRIKAVFCEFCGEWLRQVGTTPRDYYDQLRSLGLRSATEPTEATLVMGAIFLFPSDRCTHPLAGRRQKELDDAVKAVVSNIGRR
jgi:FkbM family methyltransferase